MRERGSRGIADDALVAALDGAEAALDKAALANRKLSAVGGSR